MSDLQVSNCRTCEAPIIWCTTEKGKKMPVDADSDAYGKFILTTQRDSDVPLAVFQGRNSRPTTAPLYTAHFATCPDADEHRRGS